MYGAKICMGDKHHRYYKHTMFGRGELTIDLMWNDPYAKEAIMCNQQINVSKDDWNTKKGTGKSMKDALHKLRYAKMHLLG